MSLEDKLAIQEVISQYSYTYDAQDAEGFAALFTEDAVWELFAAGATQPAIRLESRPAIQAWAMRRLHERSGRFISRHYQSSTVFETLTAGSARTRTMVLVTHQDVTEAVPRLTASGVYHDQWRKTTEGWRLVHRRLHHDTREPLISA
jgi:ketosteroid isomerase-like protein